MTDSTLAYIMLEGGTEAECEEMKARCQQWTGRAIKVVSHREAVADLASVQRLDMGIPSEWPSEGDSRMGQKILNTLRVRAAIAVQIAAPRIAISKELYAPGQRFRQPMMMAIA